MSATIYEVVLHREALGELRALSPSLRARVKEAIDNLALEPRPHGASPLQGHRHAYRLRFGDHRLIYEVHALEVVVFVVGIAHRKEVYRHLLRRRTMKP